jgi:hypothetical protein
LKEDGGKMKATSLLALIFALTISGCVTGGHQFNHGRVADLDLHKIKKSEYTGIFGEPLKITDLYAGGDKYQIVWYNNVYDYIAGPLYARNLWLEFKNEELNGYVYLSNFSDDKTDVNISKIDAVKIGVSTKDDVVSLLGKPNGKAFCPSHLAGFKDNCSKTKEVWGWLMFKTGYAYKLVEKKYVILMFGEDGKLVDLRAADLK